MVAPTLRLSGRPGPSGRTRPRRRELTLAGQVLGLQLVVVTLLLAIVGVVAFRQATTAFTTDRGGQMRSVAEYVASLGVVRDQLRQAASSVAAADATRRRLAPSVDRALQLSGADRVELTDPSGRIVAASDPALVGTRAVLGASDVRRGRGWTGDVETGGQRAVAGHAPVIGDDGRLLGLALAEQTYPSASERLAGAVPDLLLFLGLGALLGGLGTFAVSRVVKRRSRGLAPREIAGLADQREALLHSIREGVLAVGTDGRVTMMNDAARGLLGVAEDPVDRPVGDLGLDPLVVDLVSGDAATDVQDAVALVGSRVLVFNRRPASSHGRGIGTVTTMRDRTELVEVQSQLSSNLSLTDTLRAQTHEFTNQLHTIAGLVELGEYDELAGLVGSLARRRAQISGFVTQRIADAAVAALVVAKDAAATERGVRLRLSDDSSLPALPDDVSADLTTVLGNLVDNAVDACAGGADPVVEVGLVTVGEVGRQSVSLHVGDSGPGVPEAQRRAVFVRGFSTKPDLPGGRGIGLPLVQLICIQRGGTVTLGEDAGLGGAAFDVRLPVAAVGGLVEAGP